MSILTKDGKVLLRNNKPVEYNAPLPTQTKTLTLGSSAPTAIAPDSGYILTSVTPSVDTSVFKAENIKSGVSLCGVTGAHGSKIPIVGVSGTIYPQLPAGDYKLFAIMKNMPWGDPGTLVVSDYPCDFSNDYRWYARADADHPAQAYYFENNAWRAGNTYTYDVQLTSSEYGTVEIANYAVVNLTNRDSYVQTKYYPAYLIDYFDKASS